MAVSVAAFVALQPVVAPFVGAFVAIAPYLASHHLIRPVNLDLILLAFVPAALRAVGQAFAAFAPVIVVPEAVGPEAVGPVAVGPEAVVPVIVAPGAVGPALLAITLVPLVRLAFVVRRRLLAFSWTSQTYQSSRNIEAVRVKP